MENEKDSDNLFIKPTADIVVKYLLGAKGTEKALLSFINAVLEDSKSKRIEKLVETPIDIISVGPGRDETIVLRNPFV